MINRLAKYVEEPEDEKPEGDFWEVSGEAGWFYVTRETAHRLSRLLARRRPPRWLCFTDIFGAEVQVLTKEVSRISQSTAAQRAAERRFRKARQEEEKADRNPWEDDDLRFGF